MEVQKIKFNGLDFILTSPGESDSPIATIKTYQKGECPYAHLYTKNSNGLNSGKIMRFRQQIGTIDDIEFGEIIEIEVDPTQGFAGLMGNTWPW